MFQYWNKTIAFSKEFSESIKEVIHEDEKEKSQNRNDIISIDVSPKISKSPSLKRKMKLQNKEADLKSYYYDHEVEGGDEEDIFSNINDDKNRSIQKVRNN